MNAYQLITYAPGQNVPVMVNEFLNKEYNNQTVDYLIFCQTDIAEMANDIKEVCEKYVEFIQITNIPFTFYSYYGRFNSVLPESANLPNPKLIIKTAAYKCDLTSQFAYGFLIINVTKFKNANIKLDESMSAIFYLQDLAEQCYQKKLWISNCYYLDIHESWKLFKEHKNNGYNIDINAYKKEKEDYNKKNIKYKNINEFIEDYKAYIATNNNVDNANTNVNIVSTDKPAE